MSDLTWNIPLGEKNFNIIYQHRLCRPNKVWVNGILVNQTSFRVLKDFYFCWEDFGHKFEIIALPTSGFSQCFLRVDNIIIDANGKPKEKISRQINYFLQEEIAWKQLASDLGCIYLSLKSESGVYINQIFGNVSEHFVYLKFGIVPLRTVNVPGILLLIKHGTISDTSREQLTSLMHEFSSKRPLLKGSVFGSEPDYTLLMIPLIGKLSIIGHQTELKETFQFLLSHLPNFQFKCELENQSSIQTNALNVVLLNGFPLLMCEECVRTNTPPRIEKELSKEDLESPRHWGKAILILSLITLLMPLFLMPFFGHLRQFLLLIGVYDIFLNFFVFRKIGFKKPPLLAIYLFSGILSFFIYFWGYAWIIYGGFQKIFIWERAQVIFHTVTISRQFRSTLFLISSLMLLFLVQKFLTAFILKKQLKKLVNHPTIEVIYSGFFNDSETSN